jgi:hypothetical protein
MSMFLLVMICNEMKGSMPLEKNMRAAHGIRAADVNPGFSLHTPLCNTEKPENVGIQKAALILNVLWNSNIADNNLILSPQVNRA